MAAEFDLELCWHFGFVRELVVSLKTVDKAIVSVHVCFVLAFGFYHMLMIYFIPGLVPAADGHMVAFCPTLALAAFTLTAAFEPLG